MLVSVQSQRQRWRRRTELYDHLWFPGLLLRLQQLVDLDVCGRIRVPYSGKVLLDEMSLRVHLQGKFHATRSKNNADIPCTKVIVPVRIGKLQAPQVREVRPGLLREARKDAGQP